MAPRLLRGNLLQITAQHSPAPKVRKNPDCVPIDNVRPVGAGVSELRIDYGPGYRVYFRRRGPEIVVLLCGGDKSTQDRDIERAKEMAKEDNDGS